METLAVVGFGLLLRIGLPLAVLAGLFYFAGKRFGVRDAEFKLSADFASLARKPVPESLPRSVRDLRCWELGRCAAEKRQACPAFQHPELPCWQAIQTYQGELKKECLNCSLLIQAA